MPELSRFLGIVIFMYYREHGPAHFHAEYGEYEITVEIESGLVTGKSRAEASMPCWSGMSCTRPNWRRIGREPAKSRR